MSQIPDIKPDVNQTEEERRKKAGVGFFGRLFGGGRGSIGSSTGSSGAGRLVGGGARGAYVGGGAGGQGFLGGLSGLFGGAGGLGAGGGLLATKAGIIALALIGTSVAGGLGLAGYKLLGGGDSDRLNGNLSLFAPKPSEADPNALPPVPRDGSSASLDYLAQAAAKDKLPEDAAPAASAATTDGAPKDDLDRYAASAAAAAETGPINKGGDYRPFNKPGLQGSRLGELSKGSQSGGTGPTASVVNTLGGANGRGGSGSDGRLASGRGGSNVRAGASGRRGVAGGRNANARRQLGAVMKDQFRAGSSAGAGRTYDGANTSGQITGPEAGGIGMPSIGGVGAGPQPTTINPNNTGLDDKNVDVAAPTPRPVPPQPIDKKFTKLDLMMAGAMALLFLASKMPTNMGGWIARGIIGGIIVTIGTKMMPIAKEIMAEAPLHGKVAMGAAMGVIALGAYAMIAQNQKSDDGKGKNPLTGWIMKAGGAMIALAMIAMHMLPKPLPPNANAAAAPSTLNSPSTVAQ